MDCLGLFHEIHADGGRPQKFLCEAQQDLIDFVKVQFELNAEIGDSGEALRDSLLSVKRQTGFDDERLNIRPPDCFNALWGVFVGLWDGKALRMSELLAWSDLMNVEPLPIEIECLQIMARTASACIYADTKKRMKK